MVHSACVVFKIHVSHGLYSCMINFIEVPVCAKRTIQTGKSMSPQTPAGQILGRVATPVTPAALTPMNTGFLGLTRVHTPSGISPRSAVLAQLIIVSDRQSHRPRYIYSNMPHMLCDATYMVHILKIRRVCMRATRPNNTAKSVTFLSPVTSA